jgi:hypothetical protein
MTTMKVLRFIGSSCVTPSSFVFIASSDLNFAFINGCQNDNADDCFNRPTPPGMAPSSELALSRACNARERSDIGQSLPPEGPEELKGLQNVSQR